MELVEKTLGSERVYSGKIISLRVDTVLLPDGATARREIVEHKGAVAIVPMLDNETIVLVRQYRQAAGCILLEIPAGSMETGEDPEVCAQRELMEEIGYSAAKLTSMHYSFPSPGYSSEKTHMFIAEDLRKDEANSDNDEFIEVVTIQLSDAMDLIRRGEIVDAKTVCGILLASNSLNAG